MVILLTMNNRIKWLSVFLRKLIRSKQMILLSEYTHTHTHDLELMAIGLVWLGLEVFHNGY